MRTPSIVSSSPLRSALGNAPSLITVIGASDGTGHLPLPDNIQHEILDFACGRFIERRGWLIEEENFRSVGECAGDRCALSLASGEIAHVSVLIPRRPR